MILFLQIINHDKILKCYTQSLLKIMPILITLYLQILPIFVERNWKASSKIVCHCSPFEEPRNIGSLPFNCVMSYSGLSTSLAASLTLFYLNTAISQSLACSTRFYDILFIQENRKCHLWFQ